MKGCGVVKDISVVLWGLGAMGSGMARVLAEREGVRIVGAIDRDAMLGEDLGDGLGLQQELGVKVKSDPGEVFSETEADICLIATASFVSEVEDQVLLAVENGCNVISIAEEMAYPQASSPEATQNMHKHAVRQGVTILGTGINPGFVLDALIIALTGVCTAITSIRAERVNDLSPFGPTVMETQGVGTTVKEFEEGLESGDIVGHVGFLESMYLIAEALGWELDEVKQTRKPIIAQEDRTGENMTVPDGKVAGCHHTARGLVDGREVITLEHPQQVDPGAAGVETGDYIDIDGTPEISMAIQPEIPGGIGTIALAVNMIAQVVAAAPGLKTMNDLQIPRALTGDVRETVKNFKSIL